MNTDTCEPLCNIEYEQELIGNLIDPETHEHTVRMTSRFDYRDFYRPIHQRLWYWLMDAVNHHIEITKETVIDIAAAAGIPEVNRDYVDACIEQLNNNRLPWNLARNIHDQAVRREVEHLGARLFHDAHNAEVTLPDLIGGISTVQDKLLNQTDASLRTISEIAEIVTKEDQARAARGYDDLVKTQFGEWDTNGDRMGEQQLIILKGKRGTGKTHFAIDLCAKTISAGQAAVFYSLEMGRRQVINRFRAWVTQTDSRTFNQPTETDDAVWSLMNKADSLLDKAGHLYICGTSGTTVEEMEMHCRALKVRGVPIRLIAIDYAELIGVAHREESREQELAKIAEGLRNIVSALDCTVLLLSQVNKEGRTRWSEALENAADVVLNFECEGSHATIRSDKTRNGKSFTIDATANFRSSRFYDRETNQTEDD